MTVEVAVTQPWTLASDPAGDRNGNRTLTLVEGSTFCVSELGGDIVPDRAHGLFVRDTRVVSRWELRIDDVAPQLLSIHQTDPFAATCLSRLPPRPGVADSTLLVVRHRYIGDGMREDLSVQNLGRSEGRCVLELRVEADYADVFEVKEGRQQPAHDVAIAVDGATLSITRHRGSHDLCLLVSADGTPTVLPGVLRWVMILPPRGARSITAEAVPAVDGVPMVRRHPRGSPVEHAVPARRLREWRHRSPEIRTADADLATVLRRSVEDLGALRIFDPDHPERAVVAAGAPWFMALFGRDSLLTSWMVLTLDSSLAIGTLQTLAEHQGDGVDAASEEQPGRIPHEVRFGPATDFAVGGRSVYYGTADASALFVMLLGELQRWGADSATIKALRPHADRALEWIEGFGDMDGDGFVEYERASGTGLVNQGWKDSFDGINFADGRLAEAPIALAEVQGYCFAAFLARAFFAEEADDHAGAALWRDKAKRLKQAFNDAFWLPDRGWFAIGLDRDKRPIDALTSNIGHCLWTGIVDDDKAAAVADHLLSPDMFSGWGIRTLAESMSAYNPMSYHNGSVWPHDNAICASGLMRYGFVEHAQRVASAVLDTAAHFGHRLPELFCGFSRAEFAAPVPYPASCSPQAWAAAAPISFLRTLLRLDPKLPRGQVWCNPAVPSQYLPLRIDGVRVGSFDLAVDVGSDGWRVDGLLGTGTRLMSAVPRPAEAGS